MLCENPTHKIPRHVVRVQDINLTDLKIKIPVGARGKAIRKQYETGEIDNKWNSTAWAQRLKSRGLKKTLSDFDRYKAKIQKQRVSVPFFFSYSKFVGSMFSFHYFSPMYTELRGICSLNYLENTSNCRIKKMICNFSKPFISC